LAVVSVPAAAWCGWLSVTQLFIVVATVAALSLLFNVADAAYLPGLVARDRLVSANAGRETIDAGAEVIGPPIGRVLGQSLPAPAPLLIDALPYLASAMLLLQVRHVETPPVPRHERRHAIAEIRDGLRTLVGDPILRPLLVARAIRTFFGGMFGPFYVLY